MLTLWAGALSLSCLRFWRDITSLQAVSREPALTAGHCLRASNLFFGERHSLLMGRQNCMAIFPTLVRIDCIPGGTGLREMQF